MDTLKNRKQMDPAFTWDLSSLYKDDQDWEAHLPEIDSKIEKAASFRGRLKDAQAIRQYFEAETDLELLLSDIFEYAFLRKSEDTADQKAQKMYAAAMSAYVKASTATAFAQPEMLSLPEKTLRAIAEDPQLADYRYTMEKLVREKPHTLTADQEQLLAGFGEVFSAPKNIANTLQEADLTFEPAADTQGEMHEVADSSYILLQNSTDRVLRRNAFMNFYKGYSSHINTFAAAYAGEVKYYTAQARVRHYPSSRAMALADEFIPDSVYDNLVSTVRAHMPAMYRYVRLRRKILGVDELHYYDLYAPLAQDNTRHYTYEQAQQMVLDTVAPLGQTYCDMVRRAFKERWIDVYPNKGKSVGAYSSGTYRSNPFILTNFTGTLDAVSTIAHEMGHSMHTWLSNSSQPPQYADYTLFVAEVASTVNENLMIEQLLAKTEDPKERLAYLNQYLEGFKGTVYRQTMFAEFEQQAHALAEQGGALTPEALNNIYLQLIRDYFGPDLVIDDQVKYEWARIPHFYRPFYVYKYATSYSAAAALSEGILQSQKTGDDTAVRRYLEFLSMGGSRDPLDELKYAGVDFTTPQPVDTALRKFEKVVEEAEKTYEDCLN